MKISPSLDAHYLEQSAEPSTTNDQVSTHEESIQLTTSNDNASLSTQVIPAATIKQSSSPSSSPVIPASTEYQSTKGVVLNKKDSHYEFTRDFKGTVTSNSDSEVNPHTDWSRPTRKKLAFLKAGSHCNQTKLTSFFDLVDDVSSIMSKLPEIECMSSVPLPQDNNASTKFQDMFSPLFKRLISNAEINLQKLPQQIRHDSIIKKFVDLLQSNVL